MKIVAIADTHTLHDSVDVPDGDMLIFAGDVCSRGSIMEVGIFAGWLAYLPHKYKIIIAGNHDWAFQRQHDVTVDHLGDVIYLQDDMIEIEGLKIYGSPWQPEFCSWAFNLPRGDAIKQKWDMIPENIDVLVTHGPPKNILDEVDEGTNEGCEELEKAVRRVKPKYHIFGHIHEGYGVYKSKDTVFINASVCNRNYDPINKPIEIEI